VGATNGREISQEEAIRCVVEGYERMLSFYSMHHPNN
jgi:hypothetical protein